MANTQFIPQMMRALQYDPCDQKAHMNEIDIPKPEDKEILIKISCASLCHSDCLVFRPSFAMSKGLASPFTLGHEATGTVVQVGNQVTDFVKGDPVGVLASSGCFDCKACRSWSSVGCPAGVKAQGFNCDGYFQEFIVVDARSAVKLPSDIDVLTSSPLCCAGVTAYNAVKQCNLTAGDSVAIIGVGGLGQMAVQYAKKMGFEVIAVDTNGHQLNAAKILKADYTINPEICPSYANDVKRLTNGGVDAAINFTPFKDVCDDMPSMLRWGGILMLVGVIEEPLTFDCMDLIFQRYIIKAACNGTAQDLDECIRFSAKHKIKPLVEFKTLEEIPAAIEMMEAGKLGNRVCVQF